MRRSHYRNFGVDPAGTWLAECAYSTDVDALLQREGYRFFLLDTHGLLFVSPRPRCGVVAPDATPAGPAAYARDLATGRQVWSSKEGYPGDP